MTRPRRTVRGRKQSVVVTPRDLDLLELLGTCRYVSVPQVQRDLFGSADRTRHRLRQLYDAGLVNVTLLSSTQPNLVSLTRRGLAVLVEHRPAAGARIRLPGPLRLAGIEHHLGVVDARLYSAALGRILGTPLTRWSNSAGDLVRELGLVELRLAPDGIAEFAVGEQFVRVGIEVDRGTEVLAVVAKKLAAYAVVAERAVLDALWFVVTTGASRQAALRQLALEAGLAAWTRVLPLAHVLARPVRELPARGGNDGP